MQYEKCMEMNVSLKRDMTTLKVQNNELEQYSRRTCVREFGIHESKVENCEQFVTEVLTQRWKLDMTSEVIEVAHRMGKVRTDKPRGIIVRFVSRKSKEIVMLHKSSLKGSGVSIFDDLTATNMHLMNTAKKHDLVENASSINGKVIILGKNDQKHRIQLDSDITALLTRGNR